MTPAIGSSTFTRSGRAASAASRDERRERGVAEHDARARVVEDVADLLGVQARVDRDERAPTRSTAKCATRSSGTFGARNATRSPGATPARCSAPARRATSSPNSAVSPAQFAVHHGVLRRGRRAACARGGGAATSASRAGGAVDDIAEYTRRSGTAGTAREALAAL